MRFKEYKRLLFSDLYRITGASSFPGLLKQTFLEKDAFRYNFWMRTWRYLRSNNVLKYTLYPVSRFFFRRAAYKLGIDIPFPTTIGSGFYIGHFGGIVVNEKSEIGNNCNISHGVTLGISNRGKNKGYPVLGNNIYIGPGAKVIGAIKIGNNVAIGANCVVTKDVPDNSVVVGIPGKIISQKGAGGYIDNIDYPGVT